MSFARGQDEWEVYLERKKSLFLKIRNLTNDRNVSIYGSFMILESKSESRKV
jgi:hypothetical protein